MLTPALLLIAATLPVAICQGGQGWAGCTNGVLRTTVFHGEYGLEAAANLSHYRTRLYEYMAEVALTPVVDEEDGNDDRWQPGQPPLPDASSDISHFESSFRSAILQQHQQHQQRLAELASYASTNTGWRGPRRQSIIDWLTGGAGSIDFDVQASAGFNLSEAEAPVEVVGTDPEERSRLPWYSSFYAAFAPAITCPPGSPLERVGKQGDGGKWLCGLERLSATTGACVVYSLGSNGDYSFEEAVLNRTLCEVHTFDCTFEKGASIHERHFFHKVCLSQEDMADSNKERQYMRYSSLAAWLNHTHIEILKMDIEGWEHMVVAQLHQGVQALPRQLAVEMHTTFDWQPGGGGETVRLSALPMATTMLHLADLGYATVAKENNVFDPNCCTELTMLRVEVEHACAKH